MRCFVPLLPLLLVVACDDTSSLLAEGKVADACFHARNDPRQRQLVEQWHVANAPVRFTVVPQQTLADALGGPVDLLGTDPLPYDVDGSIEAAPDARVALAITPSRPLSSLVDRLPNLVVADRAPVPAVVDPTSLLPTPRPVVPRAWRPTLPSDPIGFIIEGTALAAGAVGQAIGVIVAAPIVAVGAVIGGFFDALGSIFSGGGGGASSLPAERVPIARVEAVDGTVVDALLTERELAVATTALTAEQVVHEGAAHDERARRHALLDDATLLTPGSCAEGRCRVLLDGAPATVDASVAYTRDRLLGGRDICAIGWPATVVITGTRDDAALPAEQRVHNDVEAARRARLTATIDTGAPSWAAAWSVGLPVDKARRTGSDDIRRVDRLTDMDCSVVVKQKRFDVDGSAPDLLVRATIGMARTRASTLKLGHDVTAARFIVFDAEVVAGERVRLSLTSAGDRSLGAAIVTFDGTAPLVFENPAFRAVCTTLARADDGVVDAAVIKADAAIKQLADDDNGIDGPRPDADVRARRVAAAETAVVAVAARVGWRHPAVVPLIAAVASAQERPSSSNR